MKRGPCCPGSLVVSIHELSKNSSPAPENPPHLTPHFCMTLAVLLMEAQQMGHRSLPTLTEP